TFAPDVKQAPLPSPLVGEGGERSEPGEGFLLRHQGTPHPAPSARPSPTIRAFTPVIDGLWGEGIRARGAVSGLHPIVHAPFGGAMTSRSSPEPGTVPSGS